MAVSNNNSGGSRDVVASCTASSLSAVNDCKSGQCSNSKNSKMNDSNGSANSNSVHGDKICRDFLRKVCRRGIRCKFLHVEGTDSETSSASNGNQGCGTAVSATQGTTQLTFCHDYQNNHCNRNLCKFIHCTCEEENQYLQTGHIPPHVLDQAIRKGQLADATLNGDVPICKDYLLGECEKRRGGKCKFRHLNQSEYHKEIYGYSTMTPPPPPQPPPGHHHGGLSGPDMTQNGPGRRSDHDCGRPLPPHTTSAHDVRGLMLPSNGIAPPDHKRQRLDPAVAAAGPMYPTEFPSLRDGDFGDRDYAHGLSADELGREMMSRDIRDRRGGDVSVILKRMESLQKEVAALKKENSDLKATNDFLLDKITLLGASKLNGHVSTSTSSLPTVSVAPPTLAAASSIPMSASLSAAAAQVTHVSHPLTIGPPMSMALPSTIAHPTIAAPPSIAPPSIAAPPTIAPPSIAQPTECTVQAAVQHPLTNPLITSISTDGSVGSVVAIAAPPQPPPPPTQPPPPPPPQPLAPVGVAGAPPTAVVVSVGTVQVPLSQAAITITSAALNPRITTTSMSMAPPSIAPAPTIVPSIGQTIAAPPGPAVAAANIAQAISMSQGGQAISMSQGAQAISMSQGGPPISMSQGPPISMTQPMSMSGAPGGQLLSYPIMSQPTLRTQLH